MAATKSKREKDAIRGVRMPLSTLRRADKAAKVLGIKRNRFIVRAMTEKADAVLGVAA